ncbi:hypothetical protein [Cryobacterium sp. PH31-O1]|uniref:hypothetical protein n=1 Tax=Cryobacterium sp. PH31-O1 TaxID=3046306 RepID=UPI0024BB6A4B|nr:hypothetical protein [Cryobacterium sp. PH31-O1]MDJ0337421.1 hypothetical protein [Cryobacterium sp. PH31-O1]
MLKSPGFIPRPVAVAGDHVMVIGGRGRNEWDMTGYLLPSDPEVVRLAAEAVDDDRVDPPEDWWRASWFSRQVSVVLLRRRPWVFV